MLTCDDTADGSRHEHITWDLEDLIFADRRACMAVTTPWSCTPLLTASKQTPMMAPSTQAGISKAQACARVTGHRADLLPEWVTFREDADRVLAGDVAAEGHDVEAVLVEDGAVGVRHGNNLAAVLAENLRCPCAHIAKALARHATAVSPVTLDGS